MKNKISNLSPNELIVMELFWNNSNPLSSVDIADLITEWKSAYLNNLLSSLQKKGMIQMSGVIQQGKHYIRQFVPVYTKEQYVVKAMSILNIEKKSVPKLAYALAEELSDDDRESIISELEDMLSALKGKIED